MESRQDTISRWDRRMEMLFENKNVVIYGAGGAIDGDFE